MQNARTVTISPVCTKLFLFSFSLVVGVVSNVCRSKGKGHALKVKAGPLRASRRSFKVEIFSLDQLIESRPVFLGSPARKTQVPLLVPAWISFNNLARAVIIASSLAR